MTTERIDYAALAEIERLAERAANRYMQYCEACESHPPGRKRNIAWDEYHEAWKDLQDEWRSLDAHEILALVKAAGAAEVKG